MVKVTKEAALEYHHNGRPGKIEVKPTKPYSTQTDLSLAYSPGVAYPCLEIQENPDNAYKYTDKGNLVAVITNGTAVLGLGNIGAMSGKPVMEGKGLLFKIYGGIDVFDIEIDETDPDKFCEAVEKIAPTFGGINLEDIKAPECFAIEERLKRTLDIPVMHDDQHGTAIISAAGLKNALEVAGKDIAKVQVLDAYADPTKYPEEWDLQGLVEAIDRVFSLDGLVTFDEIDGLSKDELDNFVIERLKSVITFKENLLGKGQLTSVLKSVLLKITDDFWTNQINSMAVLQEGINFRAYGQLNPLQEYKKEAFAMFEGMESAIKEQFTLFALGFQVQVNAPDEIEEDHSWDGINTIEELEAEVARRQDEIKELLMTPVDNDVNVAGKDGENKNEGERKEEESGEGKEINKENKDDDDEVVLGQI